MLCSSADYGVENVREKETKQMTESLYQIHVIPIFHSLFKPKKYFDNTTALVRIFARAILQTEHKKSTFRSTP